MSTRGMNPLYDGKRFVHATLPVVEDLDTIHAMVLRWAGIGVMLRGNQIEALQHHVQDLARILMDASRTLTIIDEKVEEMRLEALAEPAEADVERHTAEQVARIAAEHLFSLLSESLMRAVGPRASLALAVGAEIQPLIEEAVAAAVAETEGG